MAEYRKVLKDYFMAHPKWSLWVRSAMVVCLVGLLLVVLGECLVFVRSLAVIVIGSIFSALGMITMLFGLFLAFVKKDDWALIITTGVYALFELVMFIVSLARGGYTIAPIFFCIASGLLCFMAYRVSDMYAKARMRSAYETAAYVHQAKATGTVCANCGAPIAPGVVFCGACGSKQPEQRKCAGCGQPLAPNDVFCGSCGTKNA